jgi:lipoate-protein ligase B
VLRVGFHGFALNVNADLGYLTILFPAVFVKQSSLNVLGVEKVKQDEVKENLKSSRSLFACEIKEDSEEST